jgi:hypothetical protein
MIPDSSVNQEIGAQTKNQKKIISFKEQEE